MANPKLIGEQLLADTRAIPETLNKLLPIAAAEIADRLGEGELKEKKLVVLIGSGDLLHAALSTRLAIERLTGITTLALPSMQTGLYQSPTLTANSLLIQMSFSGITARAVEAATLARASGAEIWAITADPKSALAQLAHRHFLKPPTGENEAAGFQVVMAMLLLLGIGIAQGVGRAGKDKAEAEAFHAMLTASAQDMARTLALSEPTARDCAARIRNAPHVLFLASGPTWGTAVNASARIMEAVGASASAQDIEEWVHLDRWIADKLLPVVLIAPPGPGTARATEVAQAMRALGKTFMIITADSEAPRYDSLCPVLPVSTHLPEELAPLVYNLPCELLANYMCVMGAHTPYRTNDPTYEALGEVRWGGHVRTEPISIAI